MITKNELEQSLLDSIRKNDIVRKRTIRMILTSIKLLEVEKRIKLLDESTILSIIQKEIKIRKEAIQDAKNANRLELVQDNLDEIAVLEEYLPKQLTEVEISEIAKSVINDVQAKNVADMGKVMKELIPRIQGRASNDMISLIVRKLLA